MPILRSSRLLAIASVVCFVPVIAAQGQQSASPPPPPPSNQQAGTAPPATQGTAAPPAPPPPAGCISYGIDFQNNGTYFINSGSSDYFTAVNQFTGCQLNTNASVWFVPPSGNEMDCSQLPTTPDNTNQVTTCPIKKSDMTSGQYKLVVFGNNGDGSPFAWERTFQLNVGLQQTVTVTPTNTYNATLTAYSTVTSTTTQSITNTADPTTTYYVPAATAPFKVLILPSPQYTSVTETITWSRTSYTHSASVIYATETARCIIPKRTWPDCPATYKPRRLANSNRLWEFLKGEKDSTGPMHQYKERSPDEPTITVTATPAVNITQTFTVATVTNTASDVTTTTFTTTLPPSTINSGTVTSTETLPTPTRTNLSFLYTKQYVTSTVNVTWTYTTTTTPLPVFTDCQLKGGHFSGERW